MMIKKITVGLALAMLAALFLCGCSAQLTARQYYDKTAEYWKIYRDTGNELSGGFGEDNALLPNFRLGNSDDIERLKELVSRRDKALRDFEKLNPPAEYQERHYELVSSIELEYAWNDAVLKLADAKTSEDADKAAEEAAAALELRSWDCYFPARYSKLQRDLKKDLGI